MTQPRAVLYLRLSVTKEDSTSIERQEADLRREAASRGWDVGDRVLTDDGVSGGKARAKAEECLRMLRAGEADILMVWKWDRWSRQGVRSVADLADVLDARPEARFVALRDGLDSQQSDTWRLAAAVMAEIGRTERKNTSMRVASAVAGMRSGGRFAGGNVPYGYCTAPNPSGPGRVLVIADAEATVIREAAERILAGETVYAVTCDLNDRAVATRRGKTWSVQALSQILTNDPIVGRVVHRGDVVRGEDGLPEQMWEPVLPLDVWHRLRARLGVVGPRGSRGPRRERANRARLLSGIVRCGMPGCGAPLYVKYNGAGHVAYACTQRSNGRPCTGVSVSADLLDEYVGQTFLAQVGDREVYERREVRSAADAEAADVDRAITDTLAAMGRDDADVAALAGRLATLKERRSALKRRTASDAVSLVATGRTFADVWRETSGSESTRHALLAANIALLTVSKGRRGRHGLDSSRVAMVAQPAQVLDAVSDPFDFTEGRVAV